MATRKRKGNVVRTGYTAEAPRPTEPVVDRSLGRRFQTVAAARTVLRQLAEDWGEGFGAGGSSGGGTPGVGDPVGARVVGPHPDEHGNVQNVEGLGLADRATWAADRIDALLSELGPLEREVLRLLPIDHPVADMLARHRDARWATTDQCPRCATPITGVGEDRVKAGWCPSCHRLWCKRGRPDRAQFNAEGSPRVGEHETAGPSPQTADGVLLTGSGEEVRPETTPAGGTRPQTPPNQKSSGDAA